MDDFKNFLDEWTETQRECERCIKFIALANEPDLNDNSKFVRFDELAAALHLVKEELSSEDRECLWGATKVSVPSQGFHTTASFDPTNENCQEWNTPNTVFQEPENGGYASDGLTYSTPEGYIKQMLDAYKAYDWPFMVNLYPYNDIMYGKPSHLPLAKNAKTGRKKCKYIPDYVLGKFGCGTKFASSLEERVAVIRTAMAKLGDYSDVEIIVSETGWRGDMAHKNDTKSIDYPGMQEA